MYAIKFGPALDVLILDTVYDVRPILNKTTGDFEVLLLRHGNTLEALKFCTESSKFVKSWSDTVFFGPSKPSKEQYPWIITNITSAETEEVLLRNGDGMQFYRLENSPTTGHLLRRLAQDTRFHDVYGWAGQTFLFGRIFPPSAPPGEPIVGILVRDREQKVRFYAVNIRRVHQGQTNPLQELKKPQPLMANWTGTQQLFLTKWDGRLDAIGVRGDKGLEFYNFDSKYEMKRIFNTSKLEKPVDYGPLDHLLFGNITLKSHQDALQVNQSGLFLYNYDQHAQDFSLLFYDPTFTGIYGWREEYSRSIKLADLNGDGREDLIFTGPHGLSALTFDDAVGWVQLLDTTSLHGNLRVSSVVGILPPAPSIPVTSVFVQGLDDGRVYWGQINPIRRPPSNSTVLSSAAVAINMDICAGELERQTVVVPPEAERAAMPDTILRWAEQWDNSILKNAVDLVSGQVGFHLPLVQIPARLNLGLQLSISYNSEPVTAPATELGIGWTLSHFKEHVYVDLRGSIFPEDKVYYWVAESGPVRLVQDPSSPAGGHYKRFKIPPVNDISIEYEASTERWIISDDREELVYGTPKYSNSSSSSALRWSLANSEGVVGADLERIVIAWYITARVMRGTKVALYYDYDQTQGVHGALRYTASISIAKITNEDGLKLEIMHGGKPSDEYETPKTVNHKGDPVFPVPLSDPHYLQGYNVRTRTHTQSIRFDYTVVNQKRLLRKIWQKMARNGSEILFEFDYEDTLGAPVLSSIQLPDGSTRGLFTYTRMTPPARPTAPPGGFLLPVTERPEISLGPDYTVVAYRTQDLVHGVTLLVRKPDIVGQIAELVTPTRIKDNSGYFIIPRQNLIVVFQVNEDNGGEKAIHVFKRSKGTWSQTPSSFVFGKEALIQFAEEIVVILEPKEYNLTVLSYSYDESHIITTNLTVPYGRTTRLSVSKTLIVGYADPNLWISFRNSDSQWTHSLLKQVPGALQGLSKFHLDQETRGGLTGALDQVGLQVSSNAVMLLALRENSGKVISSAHFFTLDPQHRILTSTEFLVKPVPSIWTYAEDFKNDGSTFTVSYIVENDTYKLSIVNVTGKAVEDILSLGNDNKRKDALESRLEDLNKQDGWKETFRKIFSFADRLLRLRAEPQGIREAGQDCVHLVKDGWNSRCETRDVPLSDQFTLTPSPNGTEYSLYRRGGKGQRVGQPLHRFGSQLVNGLPFYLAHMPTLGSVEILMLENEGTKIGGSVRLNDEYLLGVSNWDHLLTFRNVTKGAMYGYELVIRSPATMPASSPAPTPRTFVTGTLLTGKGIPPLRNSYERTFKSDLSTGNWTMVVDIIPGGNRTLAGWRKDVIIHHGFNGKKTSEKSYFNAEGELVRGPEVSPDSNQPLGEKEESVSMTKLTDESGRLEIVDLTPYKPEDQAVAYYGFEEYEKKVLCGKTTWSFQEEHVIRRKFAFTGKSYLELKPGQKLHGEITPQDQDDIYIFSSWIRSPGRSSPSLSGIGGKSKHLKVIVLAADTEVAGLYGEVRAYSRGWDYHEIFLNFDVLRELYKEFHQLDTHKGLPRPEEVKFKFRLQVSPMSRAIDLDDLRFCPLHFEFKAKVYDSDYTNLVTDIVQSNGLPTRTIYDRYGREIGTLAEDGAVEKLTTMSKTGHLVPAPQNNGNNSMDTGMPSRLNLKPVQGHYETFDSESIRMRWRIGNANSWKISPGQLLHTSEELQDEITFTEKCLIHQKSTAFRLYFHLKSTGSSLEIRLPALGNLVIARGRNGTDLTLPNGKKLSPVPAHAAELTLMVDGHFLFLWLDAVLFYDGPVANNTSPLTKFSLAFKGQVLLEDLFVLRNPELKVHYLNAWGEAVQTIIYESPDQVAVSGIIFDTVGREALTLKSTRIRRLSGQGVLSYRKDFVTNADPVHGYNPADTFPPLTFPPQLSRGHNPAATVT